MFIKILSSFGAMIATMLAVAFLYSLDGAEYNPALGGPLALLAAVLTWRSIKK